MPADVCTDFGQLAPGLLHAQQAQGDLRGARFRGRHVGAHGAHLHAATDHGQHRGDFRHLLQQHARALGQRGGLLQRAARRRVEHHELGGLVLPGDERHRQLADQADRQHEEGTGAEHRRGRMLQAPAHGDEVAAHQRAIGPGMRGGTQHVGRHHRRQQACHQQREQHRRSRGPAELAEQVAG